MPARFVDRHLAPVVGAADVLPPVGRIRLVAELAGLRNGVELPQQPARDHVVGADVARRRQRSLTRLSAEDQACCARFVPDWQASCAALVPSARSSPLRRSTKPSSPNVRTDLPVRASMACRKLSTEKISRRVAAVGALPIVHALVLNAPRPSCTQSSWPVVASSATTAELLATKTVEDVVRVDRTEDRGPVRIEPGRLQLADVRLRDLLEGVEVRAVRTGQRPETALRRERADPNDGREPCGEGARP